MNETTIFRVNGSRFLVELSLEKSVTIWDTELEEAALEWGGCEEIPNGIYPPSPIVAEGLTEEEAFDWLMEALGLEYAYIPVTRVQ